MNPMSAAPARPAAHAGWWLRALCLAVLVVVSPGCQPARSVDGASPPSGNLLANPSFEHNGGLAGWKEDPKAAAKGRVSVVTVHTVDGRHALRLAPNARNIAAERFSTPLAMGQGFNAQPFAGKTLYVSGAMMAQGGATAVIALYAHRDDGKVLGTRLTQDSGGTGMKVHEGRLTLPADGRTRYIVLVCAVDGTQGAAYFDHVRLSTTPPGGAETAAATAHSGPVTARVTVDARHEVRRIPRTLYGTNVEWIWDGDGLWDPHTQGLNPRLVELTRRLDVSLIRFPGGVFADFYHWRNGVGPQAGRPVTAHMPGAGKSANHFGTDEALDLAKRVGAHLLITVNVATGTPEEAAAWVRYVNQTAHRARGTPKVLYWEIGNENYNKGDRPYLEQSTLSPSEYAQRFLKFAAAMRRVDPDIRLGVISDVNYGSSVPHAYPDWTRKVLKRVGDATDFVAVHNAYAPTLAGGSNEDLRTVYGAMLAAPVLIGKSFERLRGIINTSVPGRTKPLPIAVTEWGPSFGISPQNRFVDHVKTLGSALYVASAMGTFIQTPDVDIANFFKLVGPLWSGWIGRRGNGYAVTAPYYAFELYTRHFGEVLVPSKVTVTGYSTPGAGWVDPVRDVPYLQVVTSVSTDRKRLYVMAINKDFDRPVKAAFTLQGFVPAGDATAWTLNGSGVDANTGTEPFRAPGVKWARQAQARTNPRFQHGGPGEITLASKPVKGVGTHFEYMFPAHSVTALVLRRRD